MKYENANNVLPEELLSVIQKYYQGGYLYIPKGSCCKAKRQTDYKMELEKRNQHIYLKHLEGKTNGQLGNIYHLSESSIRRVIKMYEDKEQIERNIKISTILLDCNIPVAEIVPTKTGEQYASHNKAYFLMSSKLKGDNISDIKDREMARKMGSAIAQLHNAFLKCEKVVEFWDNSLLKEMKGWVRDILIKDTWQTVNEEEYSKTVETLEHIYDQLPKQLIHRDVHYGNFLFFEGNLSGCIDFDLSQKNIRIFDICYFLTGLLAEETENTFTQKEWLESVKSVIAGYESITPLSEKEKNAIPCVMECIEILCAAYFISIKDTKCANDAYHIFHFVQDCENDINNAI